MKKRHTHCLTCKKEKKANHYENCKSCSAKQRFSRLEEKIKFKERLRDANTRIKKSENSKTMWNSAGHRENVSNKLKSTLSHQDQKDKKSQIAKAMWADSDLKKSIRIKVSISRGGDGDIERLDSGISLLRRDLKSWSNKVRDRDGWRCATCKSKKSLHAHHIFPKSKFPKLAFVEMNGITLCKSCHENVHEIIRRSRR